MRTRIIFRGLTLFKFDEPVEGAKPGDNLGTLTAYLVSDPSHKGMAIHTHTPYLGFLGRDVGDPPGRARVLTKGHVAKEMTIDLKGHGPPTGVTVDGSFLDYVPRLGALNGNKPMGLRNEFITRTIVIPSGRVRTGNFISWDYNGRTPAKIAYMDTNYQGYGANEVIVDIGDDSDFDKPNRRKFLAIESKDGTVNEKLWAYTRGDAYVHGIEPNVAEVVVGNLTARRGRQVFWGLHVQALFRAAGFPDKAGYANAAQYAALDSAARQYDHDAWQMDLDMVNMDPSFQPFPFLIDINAQQDKLDPTHAAAQPYILKGPPPAPPGRAKGEGVSSGAHDHAMHKRGMGGGHDPDNSQICPPGVI